MSRGHKSHNRKAGKKAHTDAISVSSAENDQSLGPNQNDSSKTKSFDAIIKGFQEIEKIERTDSDPESQTDNDESVSTKKNGSTKPKSYAEIIRGFEEIEKIILNSQKPE